LAVHRPRSIPIADRLQNWLLAQQLRPAAPTHWWLAAFGFGLATLIFSIMLQGVFPAEGAAMPPGYGAPVIAFEFARDSRDLIAIFGDASDPQQSARLAAMQAGNEQDLLFMLLYAAFLASGCWALWRELRRPVLLLGVVMPVLAALFDLWENLLLFDIQVAFALGEYADAIEVLAAPVMAKFLLLTATNIVIGTALAQIAGRGWVLAGTLVIVPCIATVMALIAPMAFGWTLGPAIAAGWMALLGTSAIALWRLLRHKHPLVTFSDARIAELASKDRRSAPRDADDGLGAPTPIRPTGFGRRKGSDTPSEARRDD
jgi:hypothetical protein